MILRGIDPSRPREEGENLYDFKCPICLEIKEDFALFEDRKRSCRCGHVMERVFPLSVGLLHFEPYFDEGLGVDITSQRQKAQVMKLMDVMEAGDRVGGSRNTENEDNIQITADRAPIGRTIDDHLRGEDKRRADKEENFMVQSESEYGSVSNPVSVTDLPDVKEKSRTKKSDTFEERQNRLSNRSAIIS